MMPAVALPHLAAGTAGNSNPNPRRQRLPACLLACLLQQRHTIFHRQNRIVSTTTNTHKMNSTGLFTSAPKNVAAWALKPKERPLTVSSAPYTKPPKGHVVIKVYDVAINPIDWILQDQDIFKSEYPTVFGSDAAGEIAEVADDVGDFQIGTRVIAYICFKTS